MLQSRSLAPLRCLKSVNLQVPHWRRQQTSAVRTVFLFPEYARLAAENGARADPGLARGDLLAVAEAAARHLDEAALAMNVEASRRNRGHLAGRQSLDGTEGTTPSLCAHRR